MKKLISAILISALVCALLMAAGCAATKLLHCDRCGADVHVPANSNLEEDWLIFCNACSDEMGPMVEEAGE